MAKDVVLSEKPVITSANDDLEPTLLDDLIKHIGTLASVYHKRPEVCWCATFCDADRLFVREGVVLFFGAVWCCLCARCLLK